MKRERWQEAIEIGRISGLKNEIDLALALNKELPGLLASQGETISSAGGGCDQLRKVSTNAIHDFEQFDENFVESHLKSVKVMIGRLLANLPG
jgi:hypothetical protein